MRHPDGYQLGEVSARYESSGAGTISSGKGDKGGASYGTYQLSSAEGTLAKYLAWSSYRVQFEGLVPVTQAFDEKWRAIAAADPGFASDQQEFIRSTHYDRQMERLKRSGLDLSDRGPAVQEGLFSTSVQFGNLTRAVFTRGLTEAFGSGYELADLSDKDIVTAVQDYKINHVDSLFKSSPRERDSIVHRAKAEKLDLIALAEDRPLSDPGAPHTRPVLKQGSHGADVAKLQQTLGEFGYPLRPDGRFGPATRAAVEAFQRAHDLRPDGIAGAATFAALARESRNIAGHDRSAQRPCRLDEPSHPDHAFYLQTHSLVRELDRRHGRTPDQHSDNLSSALVVSGREAGLTRIDRLALGENADVVWGAQDPPGGDLLAERYCRVNTLQALNTPMAQSAAQWVQAMQHGSLLHEATVAQGRQPPVEPAMLAAQER